MSKKRASSAKWRAEHPGYMAEYRATHPTQLANHHTYNRAYVKEYRKKHPEYAANWAAEHRENLRTACSKYRETHREERRASWVAYAKANPEIIRAIKTNRYHRQRANGGNFSRAAWEHLKALFGHCCAYCGRRMERLTQDHVVPISKGGWHFSGNIVPACQSCNSRKGARSV